MTPNNEKTASISPTKGTVIAERYDDNNKSNPQPAICI
jgi:hypothetical protein